MAIEHCLHLTRIFPHSFDRQKTYWKANDQNNVIRYFRFCVLLSPKERIKINNIYIFYICSFKTPLQITSRDSLSLPYVYMCICVRALWVFYQIQPLEIAKFCLCPRDFWHHKKLEIANIYYFLFLELYLDRACVYNYTTISHKWVIVLLTKAPPNQLYAF